MRSHRAPRTALGERGRFAMVTAALVAGIGMAGVSAATAGAAPSKHDTDTPPSPPAPLASASTPPAVAPAAVAPASRRVAAGAPPTADATAGMLSFAPAARKAKPKPKPKPVPVRRVAPPPPQWVHPMPQGQVTSCFGQRWGRLHAGVDLAAATGTPIRAAGAGTVVLAGLEGGYGLAVLIDHGNDYLTHYGHMSALAVRVGQKVAVGERIGDEGNTGFSTGPHLHFEVHKGAFKNQVEPTAWMREKGVEIGGCTAAG